MSAYSDKVIADGAVAYWRLDEASGNALSQVGNYPGTVSGGVMRSQPGPLSDGNTAMAFDGTSGKIAGVPLTMAAGPFSVEAWVKSTATGTFTIFSNRSAVVTGNVIVQLNPNPLLFVPGPPAFIGTRAVNDGNWHHLVVTHDGTTAMWFIDGVLDRAAAHAPSLPGTTLTYSIGWDQPNNQWFNGTLDEVAIYNKALSAAQINAHYSLRNPLPASPYASQVILDGASAYWRLDEQSGTTANSLVGTYPGTISGDVTLGRQGALSDSNTAMFFTDTGTGQIAVPAMAISTTFTVEAWINSAISGHYSTIVSTRTSTPAGFYFGTWGGSVVAVVFDALGTPLVGTIPVTDGKWHLLHLVISSTAWSIYVDGVLDATAVRTAPAYNVPIGIGWDPLTSTRMRGAIDEVAIYPVALTPAQIATHYALRQTYDPYTQRVISDGAVAYWKLDEQAGTVAKSQVGSYDGTISGGVTLGQPGAISGYTAMYFDGTSGKISTAATVTIPVNATLEAWVNYGGDGTVQPILTLGSAERPTWYLSNVGAVAFYDNLPNIGAGGDTRLMAGTWYHVACVLNGSTITFFVNGVFDGQPSMARPSPSVDVAHIGYDPAFGGAPSGFYNGSLDELAIYHTALTPQQIAAHYQARVAWPDPPYAPAVPIDVLHGGTLSNRWLPLTPSDVIDAPFGKLWIGGAGTLAAVGADGRIVNFTGIKAGTMLKIAGRRINATGTTATNVLALRSQ